MSKIPERLRSRKLWLTVLGSALVLLLTELGFSPDAITSIQQLLMVGVGGFAVVDTAKAITAVKQ